MPVGTGSSGWVPAPGAGRDLIGRSFGRGPLRRDEPTAHVQSRHSLSVGYGVVRLMSRLTSLRSRCPRTVVVTARHSRAMSVLMLMSRM
jgi:hypothetical protein